MFYQSKQIGPNCSVHFALSNLSSYVLTAAKDLSSLITKFELNLCTDLSIFVGKPKISGLSISGTFAIVAIKSASLPLYGAATKPERRF